MTTYVPIAFDREFTSICICTLHGSLIDYRFRVKNYRADRAASSSYKDGDTFVENGILVELKYVDISPEDSPDTVKRKRTNRLAGINGTGKWVPNNIAEYFFFDEYGFLSINEKKIKDCYYEFTRAMGLVYEKMRTIYNELAE
jgi:hypothetical protein